MTKPTPELKELAKIDRVIHEPVRLMIMLLLDAVSEADFLYIQRECDLTQGNLSSHLTRLEEAGYLLIEKAMKGNYPLTLCSLTQRGRNALNGYIRTMRPVVNGTV